MKKFTRKIFVLPLVVFVMVGVVGCTDTESIPSNDLYRVIPEKSMPSYCKREVAAHFGTYSGNIFIYPIEYEKGAKLIYGKYRVDGNNLKEFVCIFNIDDTYAGIKVQNSKIKTKLCYAQ